MRILLVDDTVSLRKAVKRTLEVAGYEIVGEAGDGREAIVQFMRLRPDVTIMDYQMPRVSGLEALRAIRREFPQAAVIICSSDDIEGEALAGGAKAFILKPFGRNELLYALSTINE